MRSSERDAYLAALLGKDHVTTQVVSTNPRARTQAYSDDTLHRAYDALKAIGHGQMPGLVGYGNPSNAPIWAFRSMLDATGPAASAETRQQMYKELTDTKSAHPGFVDLSQGVLDSLLDMRDKGYEQAQRYNSRLSKGSQYPEAVFAKEYIASASRNQDSPAFIREAARQKSNEDLVWNVIGLLPVDRIAILGVKGVGLAGRYLLKSLRGAKGAESARIGWGFGSAENHIYSSMEPLNSLFPELEGVNPHYVEGAGPGVNTNCVASTNAATARLTGEDPHAMASPSRGYQTPDGLLPSVPFGLRKRDYSVSQVIEEMKKMGDGALGVVVIDQGGPVLHAINVVNRGGEVFFIDTQIGKIVVLRPDLKLRLGVR